MARKKSKKEDVKQCDDVEVKQCDDVEVKQCDDVEVKHYYVCKNKTITSMRGLILSGKKVLESDLSGGKKSLDILLVKGCIELR